MHVPFLGNQPLYAKAGDAGADLQAAEAAVLQPGERRLVGTGTAVALPEGTVGLIAPRSGLAHRAGLSIVNAPGIIDSGYRGEIKVSLVNLDPETPIHISKGDRIAQLVVVPFITASFVPVEALDTTDRGGDGYGSTGGSRLLGRDS